MPLNKVLRPEWWNNRPKKRKIEKLDLRPKQEPYRRPDPPPARDGWEAEWDVERRRWIKVPVPARNIFRDHGMPWYGAGAGGRNDEPYPDDFEVVWNIPNPDGPGAEYLEDGSVMAKVSIGADPEFFLKQGNKNISAHGIVPGDKAEPHKLKFGAVQLDGTAVEFNINPSYTGKEFTENVLGTLNEVRSMVPKKYRFNFSPAVNYNAEYFKKIPSKCKELGCDPDFDAYAYGKPNERPDNRTTMRTGAGHLHIGWDEAGGLDVKDQSHILDCCLLSKNLDAIFSMIERNWDDDTKRRKMYGKLGAFRPKKYGCEYRSLSNAWVRYPKLYPFIFDLCKRTYAYSVKGKDLAKSFNLPGTLSPDQFNLYCKRLGVFTTALFPTDFKTEVYGA